jgi:hypothetical protein
MNEEQTTAASGVPEHETAKVVLSGVSVDEETRSLNVAITDIDMPFMSMV